MSLHSPWLSIVIPTLGRPSLAQTLDAIDAQPDTFLDGVEVLVVADSLGGRSAQLEEVRDHLACERPLGRYRYLEHDGGVHCYGQPQRSYGARQARGKWVWFGQDDNCASSEALLGIRHATLKFSTAGVLVFRVRTYWGDTVWREPTLRMSNVDADCLVMRREIAASVTWGLRYEGDYDAAVEAAALSERVEFVDEIIALARPEADQRWWTRSGSSANEMKVIA